MHLPHPCEVYISQKPTPQRPTELFLPTSLHLDRAPSVHSKCWRVASAPSSDFLVSADYPNLHHFWAIDPNADRAYLNSETPKELSVVGATTGSFHPLTHRAEYQKVHEAIRHLLESDPVIRTFNVHSSTNLKIAAGKTA
jgi:hypothetical protein